MSKLDFRKRVQVVYDGWRRLDRTCLYRGHCDCCGTRVFGFTDGENDPRGMLGDRAVDELCGADYGLHDAAAVTSCAICMNNEWSYRHLVEVLHNRSRRAYRREQRTCEVTT